VNRLSKQRSEFSDDLKNQASKTQFPNNSVDQTNKIQCANALMNQGELQKAETLYRELIITGTRSHIAYSNLAAIYLMLGKYDKSIPLLKKSLELKPNSADVYINLGNALKVQGDLTAAIASYNKAIEIKPNYPNAHNNLGIALYEYGDFTAAIASFNTALRLNPNFTDAHFNLGNTLKKQGDLSAAIDSFNRALQLKPDYAEAHFNLGNAHKEQGDLTSAIASFNRALQFKSNFQEARINLGNALQEKGDLTAAISTYNEALELMPNFPEAQAYLSTAELLTGNYKKGWETYEYRFQCKHNQGSLSANPLCKQWSNDTITQGSQLLLVSEQGLGDTLQFMRYVIALKSQGASISLCAPQKLHTLIQTSGIDPSPLTPQQANKVSDGHWIPLLSVPKYLEVSPQNPIITEPYIRTTEELRAKWNDILSTEKRPIIGINWQGNPSHEITNSRGRSLPLETFAPIAQLTNTTLLSLQKGFGSEQLDTCSFKDRFVSCQDQINDTWDFLETAAIIANCDLVITSDTSVAHLAGGMGQTTWLLLKHVPEWRWGLEGDSTFWYPSMRLFRQNERDNWNELLERVAEALQEHFGGSSTPNQPSSVPHSSIQKKPIQAILAPISLGELIDKITILQIKSKHLQGDGLENVKKELEELEKTLNNLQLNINPNLIQRLKEVNQDLWQIEDDIRDQERQKNFGETFIRLARSVYQQNDRRAAIKKEINTTYGSALVEEKSYKQY